nr:uncharacterized membrane protein At4g09580-like [Tanacetum cinerariifolium]
MEQQRKKVDTRSSKDDDDDNNEEIYKFPLSRREMLGGFGVLLCFVVGLVGVYLTDNLEVYTCDYTVQVLVGYCTVYIFMQTFMIPGTVFMSLLAGSLFGVLRGVALVVFAATAGASSCYFLSKLIGRPLISSMWPDKLVFFQDQVAKRQDGLLNYMLFLRLTPTFPNMFINVASPIVNVPYHTFLLGTSIGIIPAAYVTVKKGIKETSIPILQMLIHLVGQASMDLGYIIFRILNRESLMSN